MLRWRGGHAAPHAASMGLPARPGTRILFDFQGTERDAERRSVMLPCPEMPRCAWRTNHVRISDGHLGAGVRWSSREPPPWESPLLWTCTWLCLVHRKHTQHTGARFVFGAVLAPKTQNCCFDAFQCCGLNTANRPAAFWRTPHKPIYGNNQQSQEKIRAKC